MASKATILYIEDDPSSQTLVERALSFAGYRVIIASRGIEATLREMETMNAELRRLDKVKDDFIQLTAHELRTPLTLIYGYSRLLQESSVVNQLKASSPEVQSFIVGLVDSIERMSRVINE